MAPTPNQLMIQQEPSLMQAPQQQQQITQEAITKEGEVSMPSPREWIGNIDYGIDWYKLGSQAFETAKNVYEDTLKYSISKKTAQLRDLQYDYQTQMRNEFASSVNPNPLAYDEDLEGPVDFNRPFLTSNYFQETFKKQANEIIGFKDSDGNTLDVFAADEYDDKGNIIKKGFNFDGFGTAWFNVVETARGGLYDISRDAEKVQSDLLKSFEANYRTSNLFQKWQSGESLSDTEQKEIKGLQYRYTSGRAPINSIVEAIGPDKLNLEAKASNGYPVLIVNPDNSITLNPQATQQDLVSALTLDGYKAVKEKENMDYAMSARGRNIPYETKNRIVQILNTDNISPAMAAELQTTLKYMSDEKLQELQVSGQDFSPLQKARLMVAYANAAYPGREELTSQSYALKVNSIKTPQSQTISNLFSYLKKTQDPTSEVGMRTSVENQQNTLVAQNFLRSLLGTVDSEGNTIPEFETLDESILNQGWFTSYMARNTSMQPAIYSAMLEYQTLVLNGVEAETAQKLVSQTLNAVVLNDDTGNPIISRNSLHQRIGPKSQLKPNLTQGIEVLKKGGELVDPKIEERLKTYSPYTIAYTGGALQGNLNPEDFEDIALSIDGAMIPSEITPITLETRINLLRSVNQVTNNSEGRNTASSVKLGEAFRILVATNPSVIRYFNKGMMPKTEREALQIAGVAYSKLGAPELWDWKFKQTSMDDQLMNSKDGGIPFNLNGIPIVNDQGETVNLLDDRMIVSSSNRENIRFLSSTGIPYSLLPNNYLFEEGQQEIYKNWEKLLKGQNPTVRELKLGTGPVTNSFDGGLASAAQLLATAQQSEKQTSYSLLIPALSEEETTSLLIPVTQNEARVSGKDPQTISYVADILSKSYKKPKKYFVTALTRINNNEDLFNYITTSDSDEDGKITKLDIVNNMHIAAVGYNFNATFNEETEDNYPLVRETTFWENALPEENNRQIFPYTGSTLTEEEKNSWVSNTVSRYWELGLLGTEEMMNLSAQTASGFNDLIKLTTQTILPIDFIMDTEHKSIWKQLVESNIIKKPIDTKVNFDLSGMFGRPNTLEGINRYKERFGKLPPNITEDEYQTLNKNTKQISPGAISDKPYLDLISEFEGLRTEAYWDSTGKVWTIGRGTTRYPNGKPVKQGDKITEEEATQYMENHIQENIIPRLSKTIPTWNQMTVNQKASLISFAYNMKNGENFYGNSKFETLTKAVSSTKNFKNVPNALKLYNKSDGKVLKGLVRRRKAEADLWSK